MYESLGMMESLRESPRRKDEDGGIDNMVKQL